MYGGAPVIIPAREEPGRILWGTQRTKPEKDLYSSTVIPNRGAWLEYETDSNDCMYIRVDRTRKLPVTVFFACDGPFDGYGPAEFLWGRYISKRR